MGSVCTNSLIHAPLRRGFFLGGAWYFAKSLKQIMPS